MLDPQAGDEQREKIAADTRERLSAQGTISHDDNWGLRKMAYEIEQRTEADYRFFRFAGEKPLLDDLDHNLKITDGVLRFRIFKAEEDAPTMVPPDTEQIMRRDEDDERPRGRRRDDRGGRDDRGPRRPREDSSAESSSTDAPAPAPTRLLRLRPSPSPPIPLPASSRPAAPGPRGSKSRRLRGDLDVSRSGGRERAVPVLTLGDS